MKHVQFGLKKGPELISFLYITSYKCGTCKLKEFAFLVSLGIASEKSCWKKTPPRCAQLTLEQNVQKANKLYLDSDRASETPPFNSLTLCDEKQSCSSTPPSSSSLPPLSVRERQRNFIEKMEGTGKTRVPGGVLQGFRLHQRLPFSAGR